MGWVTKVRSFVAGPLCLSLFVISFQVKASSCFNLLNSIVTTNNQLSTTGMQADELEEFGVGKIIRHLKKSLYLSNDDQESFFRQTVLKKLEQDHTLDANEKDWIMAEVIQPRLQAGHQKTLDLNRKIALVSSSDHNPDMVMDIFNTLRILHPEETEEQHLLRLNKLVNSCES